MREVRNGNLYVACGLIESDPILEHGEDIPLFSNQEHPFNVFLDFVAVTIVGGEEEYGWKKNELKKSIIKRLYEYQDAWVEEIRRNPPRTSITSGGSSELRQQEGSVTTSSVTSLVRSKQSETESVVFNDTSETENIFELYRDFKMDVDVPRKNISIKWHPNPDWTESDDEYEDLVHFPVPGNDAPFPDNMWKMRWCEDLQISGTRHSTIPSNISNFVQLKVLSIHESEIIELPPMIGNLTNLELLNLQHCPLLIDLPEKLAEYRV